MQVSFLSSVHDLDPAIWDACWADDYPFTRHAFFAALEDSGSTVTESGWQPHHALISHNSRVVGLMPLFQKSHSYGEYVFDWGWADAYAQHQLDYYPKLINAVPFTPATGPRLGLNSELSAEQRTAALTALQQALAERLEQLGGSSWHSLFPHARERDSLAQLPLVERIGYQFHWFNRGYQNFDHFLADFNSRKRKAVKRERSKVAQAGVQLRTRTGSEVSPNEWRQFYRLYQLTYLKRSGSYGYLGRDFFPRLAAAIPEHIVLVSAHSQETPDEMLAAAFYLRDASTLYGRYWGAQQEYDGLHFEACYYRGIEYAISHKLARFDPGAQGEHKIQRGFVPVATCSYHWLEDARFAEAVANFCSQEAQHVQDYIADARRYLPFREEIDLPAVDVLLRGI